MAYSEAVAAKNKRRQRRDQANDVCAAALKELRISGRESLERLLRDSGLDVDHTWDCLAPLQREAVLKLAHYCLLVNMVD